MWNPLKVVFECKLEDAGAIQRIDNLERFKGRIWNQKTLLVESLAVAAGASHGLVLYELHAISVLDVEVCVIKQIGCLKLEHDAVFFGNGKPARQTQIDLLSPGAVKGIQSDEGAWSAAIDSQRGVRGGLIGSSVIQVCVANSRLIIAEVQRVYGTCTSRIKESSVRPARRKEHDRTEGPVGKHGVQEACGKLVTGPRLINERHGKAMPLVKQIGRLGTAEIELIAEVHTVRHDVLGKSVGALHRETANNAAASSRRRSISIDFPLYRTR